MPNSDKEFLIRVKADIQKAVKDLHQLSGEVKNTGKDAGGASKNVNSLGQSVNFLVKAAATYISLRMVYRLLRQADAYNVLQARIKNATRETGDYVAINRELYALSRQTGTALKDTVDVFQRLAQSRRDLGATNDELVTLTELVQKLGVISGASGPALSAGLLQFGQGLSAGVFRAEEFNSIVENLPALADALAKGMGKTSGELRKMVLEGKLLSRDVMQAVLSQSQRINAEFKEMPISVERAEVSLSNSLSRFLSELDQAANGTGALAWVMNFITEGLDGWSDFISETDLEELMRRRAEAMRYYQQYLNAGFSKTSNLAKALSQQIGELDAAIKAANQKLGAGDDNAASGERAPKPITPEEQARLDQITKLLAALDQEAATTGKTRQEINLYKLAQLGASEADLQRAQAAMAAAEATEQQQRIQQAALQVYEATRTEHERLAAELERLDALLAGGAISWDTYARAVFDTQEGFTEFVDEAVDEVGRLEAAIKGWGDQFTNTLADMVTEGKFNFKALADSIINDLLRILIYQNITRPVLGMFGVSVNHSGGVAGGSGTVRQVSPALFAMAPRYHTGGFAGLAPGEVPAILQQGEEILPRDDPRHALNMNAGNSVRVEMINQGAPAEAKDTQVRFDGGEMVITVLLDDLNRQGRFTSALANKFKLPR